MLHTLRVWSLHTGAASARAVACSPVACRRARCSGGGSTSTTAARGTRGYIQIGGGVSGAGFETIGGRARVGHKGGERGFEIERYGTAHLSAALTDKGSRWRW
jgi:hypothetical protein